MSLRGRYDAVPACGGSRSWSGNGLTGGDRRLRRGRRHTRGLFESRARTQVDPRTRQSSRTLAAFRPWGVKEVDAAGVHRPWYRSRPHRPPRSTPRGDGSGRAPRPVPSSVEDSPSGLWRSLGKRVGLTALRGSNPLSSAIDDDSRKMRRVVLLHAPGATALRPNPVRRPRRLGTEGSAQQDPWPPTLAAWRRAPSNVTASPPLRRLAGSPRTDRTHCRALVDDR